MKIFGKNHKPALGALEILKYIGPGFIVTVGFIDPGNWASNVAAGSEYGYELLWMVTLSTIMLIMLQHNAAHLGIATGLCLSEAATRYLPPLISRVFLVTAVIAAITTAFAEILGGAIGLRMLFGLPIPVGGVITATFAAYMLFFNKYKKLEKYIIGFVSLIGLAFLFELWLVNVEWGRAVKGWVTPYVPQGSIPIVMSVLGAVVMPHNLFLHSEIIQSRQWNLENETTINKQLKYEFLDTLVAMIAGWAINSAMIIVAAAVFFSNNVVVTELAQAQELLKPLLGNAAAAVFAIALILSGFSSSITAMMSGASIFSGIFSEPYDITDSHSKTGAAITLIGALLAVLFFKDPFQGLVWSQVALSIQLPWTIFVLIYLTSSEKVMGKFANSKKDKIFLWLIAGIVSFLNIALLVSILSSVMGR